MQVSQVSDMITHAVIGGSETIQMGVSDDPALMMMLSKALYSDQKLAVIRETMCNAWDAHIESGITDKPIKITLDSEKLVIRDFGPGIPPDLMGPLYGTYGGTSKKNDGKQTGGFGLGCKSPFSYAEHFGVKSLHAGIQTIYTISKSSAEREGRPGITPIVSFPTQDSGLEVSINLLTGGDRHRFEYLIKRIASNGEILVELNGALLPTLPFSKMQDNWLITSNELHDRPSVVNVRYGNVIYPVEQHDTYKFAYRSITDFLSSLSNRYGQNPYRIVLQADPNSLSITPSRESVSMQEHTIKTLSKLLDGFMPKIRERLFPECVKVLDAAIADQVADKRLGTLLTPAETIPGTDTYGNNLYRSSNPIDVATTAADVAQQYVRHSYPTNLNNFYKVDLSKRLDAALQIGVNRKGHVQQLKRLIAKPVAKNRTPRYMANTGSHKYNERIGANRWYQQRIARPLARDIKASGFMDIKQMFICSSTSRYSNDSLTSITDYHARKYVDLMPLLRDIVYISTSKKDIPERIGGFSEMKKLGSTRDVFVYLAPVSKKTHPDIREFFKKRGYTVLDATVPQPHIIPVTRAPIDPTLPKKEKPVGWPSLEGVNKKNHSKRIDFVWQDGAPRVINPVAYTRETPSRSDHRSYVLNGLDWNVSELATELFAADVAVIKTDAQEKEIKKMHIPPFNEILIDSIYERVTESPEFLTYWPESVERALGQLSGVGYQTEQYNQIEHILSVPEVRTMFGLGPALSKMDQIVKKLWQAMATEWRYAADDRPITAKAARTIIEGLPVSQAMIDLVGKFNGSKLITALDYSSISVLNTKTNLSTIDRTNLVQIIKLALNG